MSVNFLYLIFSCLKARNKKSKSWLLEGMYNELPLQSLSNGKVIGSLAQLVQSIPTTSGESEIESFSKVNLEILGV